MKSDLVIFVPEAKFRELDKRNSAGTIAESGKAQTVTWLNDEYVPAGAMGTGGGGDWACIYGHKAVELSVYKGDLEPLPYSAHFGEVDKGKRERCYNGMLVKQGSRRLVMTGPEITFKKLIPKPVESVHSVDRKGQYQLF
jgi:hypothetical protein